MQSDEFNASRIETVIAVAITSNTRLAEAPGNVLLRARASRLPKSSVANVSQVVTLDRRFLTEKVGRLDARTLEQVESGLRLVLDL
jgi:mRNA interferase MazF